MGKEEIKALRASTGLSQVEFGDLIGVSSITVSRWERGVQNPVDENLEELRRLQDEREEI